MEQSSITLSPEIGLRDSAELTTLKNEALSRRYGLNTTLILRLSTGEYAVLNRKFELLAIFAQFAEIEAMIVDRPDREPEAPVYKKPAKSGKLLSISLEDLGL